MLTHGSRLLQLFAAIALVAIATGCVMAKPKKKSGLMKSARDVTFAYTAEEMRLLMRDAVGPITGRIEETADHITAQTTDPAVRRAALIWKLEAMPAYREALFRADPIAAVFDSLGLTLQMETFLTTGSARDAFGDLQPLALATCREIEADHLQLIDRLIDKGDPDRGVQLVRDWARDNPIVTSIASRDSIVNMSGSIKRRSGTGLVSGIGVTVDDVVRRVEIYSDQLPRQARWQAELFTMELMDGLEVDGRLDELSGLIASVERMAGTVEEIEELVARERAFTLGDVDRQRLETLEFVAARLAETFAFVREERMAVVAEVEEERLATIDDVREELRLLLETFGQERELILTEADTLAERLLVESFDRVDGMVNRLLLKVALLLGAFLLVAALVGFVLVRAARRPA